MTIATLTLDQCSANPDRSHFSCGVAKEGDPLGIVCEESIASKHEIRRKARNDCEACPWGQIKRGPTLTLSHWRRFLDFIQ